jgi:hypothetical protein
MKNITVTLDPQTAKWLRMQAAEKEMSVSRFVSEVLREKMKQPIEYERAMRRFMSQKPFDLTGSGEALPSRDEIHDRSRIR